MTVTDRKNVAKFTFPSDLEIAMSRVFDAPRELVFKVCTDPSLVPQWWGPRNLVTTVDKMDVETGRSLAIRPARAGWKRVRLPWRIPRGRAARAHR